MIGRARPSVFVRQLQGKEGADGGVTVSWSGSALSDAMVVPHGLGRMPAQRQATANDPSINAAVTAADDTNLTIRCRDVDGTVRTGNFGVVLWWAR